MEGIRVRAPASSANLGSAFDAAAVALALYNEVTATPADRDTIEVTGEGADALRSGAPNLLLQALDRFARETGWRRPPLSLRLHNRIPLGRGLGSSAAAIVAGIRLGEALRGTALPAEQRLALAAAIEGHADNTTAALLGGFTVAVPTAMGLEALRLDVPTNLRFAVFVPEYVVSTDAARAVLPQHVSRADAIYNVGRAALLVGALATGALHLLGAAMDDRLHQPYRMSLYQAMQPVLDAARAAGAYGAAVSGAGPSALAPVAAERAANVAGMMLAAARNHAVLGQPLVLSADTVGACVTVD
jgi:homoserine kinase